MTKGPLRLIFMGTPDFAAEILRALLTGPDRVVAVVCQPDREKGRGKKLSPPPTKILAESAGLPVLQPQRIKTGEFQALLQSYAPDIIVVAAYGRILPPHLLTLPPLGCINVHGSILPAYRGAAPVQWAVINGETEVGVTIMQMNEGMDTGDLLLTAKISPTPQETAGSLMMKLARLGGETILKALEGLKAGTIEPIPQDHDKASFAPMLKKDDGIINWGKSAEEIERLIRGLDPWPSAVTFLDETRIRLFTPEVIYKDCSAPPGTILQADRRGMLVVCGKHALMIHEVQPEGKKRMAVEAFCCGHTITPGTLLK